MGDMTEMYEYLMDYEQDILDELLNESDERLYARTAKARSPIVVSIRNYFKERGRLSDKQRYVLAKWLLINMVE